MEDQLLWNAHGDNLAKKLNNNTYLVRQCSNNVSQKSVRTFCLSTQDIFLQKRAVRIIACVLGAACLKEDVLFPAGSRPKLPEAAYESHLNYSGDAASYLEVCP